MTGLALKAGIASQLRAFRRLLGLALLVVLIVLAGRVANEQLTWVTRYPSAWILPLSDWIATFFEWLVYELRFFSGTTFEFSPRDVTRGFVSLLSYPLAFTESLFSLVSTTRCQLYLGSRWSV